MKKFFVKKGTKVTVDYFTTDLTGARVTSHHLCTEYDIWLTPKDYLGGEDEFFRDYKTQEYHGVFTIRVKDSNDFFDISVATEDLIVL